ncbi:BTB/POZ domain-containing protein kctd6 [Quaeritorhiza haematococci]|nr:BTB/POZ domain-containing protein kctd6 [Quaeritorhiza haematococci]
MAASTGNNDLVTLDVAGRIFKTTRSTLQAVPESMLAAMFREDLPFLPGTLTPIKDTIDQGDDSTTRNSSELKEKSRDTGSIFLDRDPQTFEVVLRYLRTRKLLLENNSPITLEMVEAEADFFQLSELKSLCGRAITEEKARRRKAEKDAAAAAAPPPVPTQNPSPTTTTILILRDVKKGQDLYTIPSTAVDEIQNGTLLSTIANRQGVFMEHRGSREGSMVSEIIERGYSLQKVEQYGHWMMFQRQSMCGGAVVRVEGVGKGKEEEESE